jgi:uncharacterized protein (TIGR02646 family)
MIRIHKPDPPPFLRRRGPDATRALLDAYDASPAAFLSDEWIDHGIYSEESVKRALRAAQHDKCAFCESKFSHTGYGDVEHLRPKSGFKQKSGDKLGRPGYYWLAYEWSNLFFSCQLCNQRFKRNLFPLRDPAKRAMSHRAALHEEEPLLVDPGLEDPTEFISFRRERAVARRNNAKGRATINAVGLNREELREQRLQRLRQLELFVESLTRLKKCITSRADAARVERIGALVKTWVQDQAEYAAMTRAALRSKPAPPDV